MIKIHEPLARFTLRMSDDNDGLILGILFKNHNFFEKNQVYEIYKDIFGGISIKKIGESWLKKEWNRSVNQILDLYSKYFVLTKDEYNMEVEKGNIIKDDNRSS